jgi:hypothetical protein
VPWCSEGTCQLVYGVCFCVCMCMYMCVYACLSSALVNAMQGKDMSVGFINLRCVYVYVFSVGIKSRCVCAYVLSVGIN